MCDRCDLQDGRNTRDTRRKTAPILVLEPEVVYAPKSSPQIPAKNVQGPWGYPKSRPPKKEKSKATSVFHVSEAYIPRMKDDEFLFEETQIRKFTDGREPFHQSTPSLQVCANENLCFSRKRTSVNSKDRMTRVKP